MFRVGVVAIGRNEGLRLERCLRSVVAADVSVVYVDSASTDGSRELARGLGVDVVELDLSIPFTAARRGTPARRGCWRSPRSSTPSSSWTRIARWLTAG